MKIELRPIKTEYLKDIHQQGYTEETPFWASMNAPYFDEYRKLSFDEFMESESKYYLRDSCLGILYDGKIIGTVSYHWENKITRWLEIGIVIFEPKYHDQGIGKEALSKWISECFNTFAEIERVGLTTWSGNLGMMRLAEKCGLQEEARIRKVRYYQGTYYDSMKYGILREEWEKLA